jgi:hypothetical protein
MAQMGPLSMSNCVSVFGYGGIARIGSTGTYTEPSRGRRPCPSGRRLERVTLATDTWMGGGKKDFWRGRTAGEHTVSLKVLLAGGDELQGNKLVAKTELDGSDHDYQIAC